MIKEWLQKGLTKPCMTINRVWSEMGQISANIDKEILEDFRRIIYFKYGLKKGDFKKAIQEAMKDYIEKHADLQYKNRSNSDSHKS